MAPRPIRFRMRLRNRSKLLDRDSSLSDLQRRPQTPQTPPPSGRRFKLFGRVKPVSFDFSFDTNKGDQPPADPQPS